MRLKYSLLPLMLMLTACNATGIVPGLYAHHTDEFRSPPGKEARDIGYEYAPEHNAASVKAWQIMISDLVDKLEAGSSLAPSKIYLVPHQTPSAFMNMYDHALRKTLNDRGYEILPRPFQNETYFFFEATPAFTHPDINLDEDAVNAHHKPMHFRLVAMKERATLAMVEETYNLPLIGYRGEKTTVYPATIVDQIFPVPPKFPDTGLPKPDLN